MISARKALIVLSAVFAVFFTSLSLAQSSTTYEGQLFSLKGHFIQGGVVYGTTQAGNHVTLNDQPVLVSKSGNFVFGFDRDGESGDVLKITDVSGKSETHTVEIASREYQIQRIEGIKKKHMKPSEAHLKRVRKENRQVGLARKADLNIDYYINSFIWPSKGPITGVFGSQRVYNGEPRRPHYGVDVAAPVGTLVVAPVGGKVTLAHPDMFYSGGTLILDHGHGLSSSFLHLSELLVKEGDWVKQGWPIAKIGATGRVTGAHLDWRMNWFKRRVDPQLLVPPMETVLKTAKSE